MQLERGRPGRIFRMLRQSTMTWSAAVPAASSRCYKHPVSNDPAWHSMHRGWRNRGYLPHFDMPLVAQFITFRLADSIPPTKLAQLRQRFGEDRQAEFLDAVEAELDSHHGNCWLRDARIAKLIEDALLHFDGERYRLIAWMVMPNHVHVVVEVLPGYPLPNIVHSWKSFTAHAANEILA